MLQYERWILWAATQLRLKKLGSHLQDGAALQRMAAELAGGLTEHDLKIADQVVDSSSGVEFLEPERSTKGHIGYK